ncbi:SET domain-containing protein-lysine N-methyltransferase [Pseudodesulfovibrio senegalensis]|uniref:SET domain-containing protein-lysine N-methyltransferase n=1 Tax=Pseudodesulfovibrio senegalensis TaxID=1721087 RepID=A0A6N6N464_9BACT|nr:SET domain-containing protein-lysine N-methyltransferase [Pseudodesulfovibrio senegalensis]KAB1442866.1 SET domain-containing protein-lysine N-methyltransferase [Pseudodesulfovibrio senegalensis]
MMHPNTELRAVNPTVGYGFFATKFIPYGTIVHVNNQSAAKPADAAVMRSHESNLRPLGGETAPYVSRGCNFNTISTSYGFEIAVRNIDSGEELRDATALFGLAPSTQGACACSCSTQKPYNIESLCEQWDQTTMRALEKMPDVHQPLMEYMDNTTRKRLRAYLCGEEPYPSIASRLWLQGDCVSLRDEERPHTSTRGNQ